MRLRTLALALATVPLLPAANPFQPVISPNGVVNAASYLSPSFANYGIARGSIFVVFGSALGPVDLVQAPSYPLPTSEGLAGTRVLISIGAYNAACPMLYSSLTQIAAIMPSNAPEGDGSLVVSYQNMASTSVSIHVVRSAFGVFTRNQAGSGPAIVQNFVSAANTPLNSLTSSAAPGQIAILWGTGLGPVAGDEAAGPLPGSLPYLDSLYVGGVQANVRYAGRSGCCAGVDQIQFDVPPGVSGCYVPVAAVTGGVVSNFGTISVNVSGKECDDPMSYRATVLTAAERGGLLRSGLVRLSGSASAEVDLSADFFSVDLDTVLAATNRIKPPVGACTLAVTRVDAPADVPPGKGLNAGISITVNGPPGQWAAGNTSSGGYFGSKAPAQLSTGSYAFTSNGGGDVGQWSATLNVPAAALWTNLAAFSTSLFSVANPLTFTWSPGDPGGYVTLAPHVGQRHLQLHHRMQCRTGRRQFHRSRLPDARDVQLARYRVLHLHHRPGVVLRAGDRRGHDRRLHHYRDADLVHRSAADPLRVAEGPQPAGRRMPMPGIPRRSCTPDRTPLPPAASRCESVARTRSLPDRLDGRTRSVARGTRRPARQSTVPPPRTFDVHEPGRPF